LPTATVYSRRLLARLVPFAAVTRFFEDAARRQGIGDLELRMGASSNVDGLGTFRRLICQSLTLHGPSPSSSARRQATAWGG
jgi:hypothetical protein